MIFAAKTDKGKVRENNEDFFYANENVLIVADGMGGHNAGEVASRIATETIVETLSGFMSNYGYIIDKAINKANEKVFSLAKDDRAGMGTTVDICMTDGEKLYIGHVGDSRVYLIRDGEIKKITEDHSYVEMLIKKGEITEEEAKNYQMKNMITRAIGVGKEVKGDFYEIGLEKSDKVLLCTDGLTNMLTDNEILKIVSGAKNIATAVDKLVSKANSAGGKDNITVILAEKNVG